MVNSRGKMSLQLIDAKLRYIKYCLLLFIFVLVLTGITLIIIGSTLNAIYNEFSYFLNVYNFSPATLLVSIGFIVFGIACIGLYGGCRENAAVIMAFGLCLGFVFLLQIGAGVSCFFMLESLTDHVRDTLNTTISSYWEDYDAAYHMDSLQQNLYCCGMDSPKDWTKIPASCCSDADCSSLYNDGCYTVLWSIVEYSGRIFSSCAFILALMQFSGMCFAIYLAGALKKQKMARIARLWALRDKLIDNFNDKSLKL